MAADIALIYSDFTDSLATDVKAKLTATGGFGAIDLINARTTTPTLALLDPYDAVLVWSNSSFKDNVAFGNALADYSDQGHGVVTGMFTNGTFAALNGRWASEGYAPIVLDSNLFVNSSLSLGTIAAPSHPLLAGVSKFRENSVTYRAHRAASTATVVANWSDNTPLLVDRNSPNGAGHIVGLNFHPASSNAIYYGWDPTTDGAKIIANSLHYAANETPDFLRVVDVLNVAPDPRNTGVDAVDVVFSQAIDELTFDFNDIALTHNNSAIPLDNAVTVTTTSTPNTYRISGLAPFTHLVGSYSLTVNGAGVTDAVGKAAFGKAVDAWKLTGPQTLDVLDVTPDPRNTAVSFVDVKFSSSIDLATFDFHDIALQRNGLKLPLNSSVTVAATGATNTYRISGLGPFTDVVANYTLTVQGAGLKDEFGHAGEGAASDNWTLTVPQVLDVVNVSPDPRNTSVDSIVVKFNFPLQAASFDFNDLELVRDSTIVSLNSSVSITRIGSTANYKIAGLAPFTSKLGTYSLQVKASGVTDLQGHAGIGSASDTWSFVGPQVVDIVDVSPDSRNSAVDSVDLKFLFPLELSTFDFNDISLKRNNIAVPLNATVTTSLVADSTYRISGLTGFTGDVGSYLLSVAGGGVNDLFGNAGSGTAFDTWSLVGPQVFDVVDVTPDPRNTPVEGVDVRFSVPVDLTTLDFHDVILKRNNVAVALDNSVTITQVGTASTYHIAGLIPFTTADGSYQLSVDGAGVTDALGHVGAGVAWDNWTIDTIAPTVLDIIDVSPDPRIGTLIPVYSVDVTFSERVSPTSFNIQDISLTLNSGPNLITSSVGVYNAFGNTYRIYNLTNITKASGKYLLTVGGSFRDFAGNAGSNSVTDSWVSDLAPSITLPGQLLYFEDRDAPLLAATAVVTDTDTPIFTGGKLKVSITAKAQASDRLEIRSAGNGAGEIGVSGADVTYAGVKIGSFTGGIGNVDLVVSLNDQATQAATQALIRSVTFRSIGEQLTRSTRKIGMVLNDGVVDSIQQIKSVVVLPVNDAPQVTLAGAVGYQLNSAPILLASTATITDADTPKFANGSLRVAVSFNRSPADQLGIGGAFAVVGSDVQLGSVTIGSFVAGGVDVSAWNIKFNDNATVEIVQQLVQSITFLTVAGSSLKQRLITFSLRDGRGAETSATKTVDLTA